MKNTVGADDLRTSLHGTLVLWTIEASPEEAETLKSNGGISHVYHHDLPMKRDDDDDDDNVNGKWYICPKDGKNKAQCDATEQFLQNLVKPAELLPGCISSDGTLEFWSLNMTNAQRAEALKDPGVSVLPPPSSLQHALKGNC